MGKFCPMCGTSVPENSNNCPMCGNLINYNQNNMYNQQPNMYVNQPIYNNQPDMTKPDGFAIASLILGIISLVGCIGNLLILPFAILGIIFGCVSKRTKGMKTAGIVLSSIAIVLVALILLFVFVILGYTIDELMESVEDSEVIVENDVSGYYNCKTYSGTGESAEYSIVLELKSDNTFMYGPYGNLDNNYAKGTYSYVDEDKENGEYEYYMITFNGAKENFIIDGVPSDHDFNSKMEFGITEKNGKREGILVFTHNYNMYYCYER